MEKVLLPTSSQQHWSWPQMRPRITWSPCMVSPSFLCGGTPISICEVPKPQPLCHKPNPWAWTQTAYPHGWHTILRCASSWPRTSKSRACSSLFGWQTQNAPVHQKTWTRLDIKRNACLLSSAQFSFIRSQWSSNHYAFAKSMSIIAQYEWVSNHFTKISNYSETVSYHMK